MVSVLEPRGVEMVILIEDAVGRVAHCRQGLLVNLTCGVVGNGDLEILGVGGAEGKKDGGIGLHGISKVTDGKFFDHAVAQIIAPISLSHLLISPSSDHLTSL